MTITPPRRNHGGISLKNTFREETSHVRATGTHQNSRSIQKRQETTASRPYKEQKTAPSRRLFIFMAFVKYNFIPLQRDLTKSETYAKLFEHGSFEQSRHSVRDWGTSVVTDRTADEYLKNACVRKISRRFFFCRSCRSFPIVTQIYFVPVRYRSRQDSS